ncbi:helix-turn-helix transcriptional regulator [Leucobacter sp. gxy201]
MLPFARSRRVGTVKITSTAGLFEPGGPPLIVRDHTAHTPSGRTSTPAVKVVFTISGWARVQAPFNEVLLEPGTILTIPANLECQGVPARHARTMTFYLEPEYLADQMRWLPLSHPLVHHLHRALEGVPRLHTLQLPAAAMHDLAPVLARLSQASADVGDFARLSMAFDVFDAVGRLSGMRTGSIDTARTLPRREVATAIALLRSDLARAWRIEELAREVAVSPSHLARLFRAQTGISPAAFLRQLRADQMAELLATTSLTVGDAGSAVGWHDMAMASRSFKQRYGVPPSTYASSYRRSTVESLVVPEPIR